MHTPTYTHTHIDITLERIHVANLPGNTINALIKIGTYGPPGTCMSMPMSMPMPMFMPIHMRVGSVLTDRRGITIIHMRVGPVLTDSRGITYIRASSRVTKPGPGCGPTYKKTKKHKHIVGISFRHAFLSLALGLNKWGPALIEINYLLFMLGRLPCTGKFGPPTFFERVVRSSLCGHALGPGWLHHERPVSGGRLARTLAHGRGYGR